MFQLITDFGFGFPGDYQIKTQSEYTDVYYYLLGYRSSKAAAVVPEWLGRSCQLYLYTCITAVMANQTDIRVAMK